MFVNLFFIAVLILEIVLTIKNRNLVSKGQTNTEPLTKKQKVYIWILSFLNPVLAGAIFYYGWKKRLPLKARQANNISLWAFLILIIISVGYFIFTGSEQEKVNIDSQNRIVAFEDFEKFDKAFEGKTYREGITYCNTFDPDNRDYCLLTLVINASGSEEENIEVEKTLCPLVSERAQIMCHALLNRCDSIKDDDSKKTCVELVKKKNDSIEAETRIQQ